MDDLAKREKIASLFEIYSSLLSASQKETLEDYYVYDLSLAEIAANRNSSRSAVEDALKKGEKKLIELEDKLKIKLRTDSLKTLLEEAKKSGDYTKLEDYINGI